MILAIPVDEQKVESTVCVSLGRTPYFMFYNTDDHTSFFLNNPGAHAESGAGIKTAQTIIDHNADVLLTIRCGQNAAELLNATDIKIYKTTLPKALETISAFNNSELALMTEFHAGFLGHQ
ncbi:MAG: NifB/NifX family molybdenum-iron cluster-binding protein [Eubacterium sp.]